MYKLKNRDLQETLKTIARSPDYFRRDTPLLMKALDRLDAIKRELTQPKTK